MSESGDREDCPFCLEPLPPFWDTDRIMVLVCCGKQMCRSCSDKQDAFLATEFGAESRSREEQKQRDQLETKCPLCRAELPDGDRFAKEMLERFDEGRLPLRLYPLLHQHELHIAPAKGIDILREGAEKGHPECQHLIGDMYSRGAEITRDGYEPKELLRKSPEDAKRWLLAAAEQGHAIAEYKLALIFREECDPQFLQHMEGSAAKGYSGANFSLGVAYISGSDGVRKSNDEAKKWLLAATEQGHMDAQYRLALILQDEGDDSQSVHYMRDLVAKGHDDACYYLGHAYSEGCYGVEESCEEAIRVLTSAAERGHASSMNLLGAIMCLKANPEPWKGPQANPYFAKGMHWIRRAVEKGDSPDELKYMEQQYSLCCFGCNMLYAPELHEKPYLRCARCCAAWYCSKDCQVRHWKGTHEGHDLGIDLGIVAITPHKKFCVKWRSDVS